jgi:hypothetical protein
VKLSGYPLDPFPAIEFPDVGKLMSQKYVRESIAARVGKLIPKMKAPAWDRHTQMILDACIEEDGSEELEAEGAARLQITQYLGKRHSSVPSKTNPHRISEGRWCGKIRSPPAPAISRFTLTRRDLRVFPSKP